MASETENEENLAPSINKNQKNHEKKPRPDIEDRLHFPEWYVYVTWWLPLSMALIAGALTTSILLGYVALPAALSMFEWGSAFIASLQGVSSIVALTAAVGAVASMAYFSTLLFARGLTAHIADDIARNNQREYGIIEKKLMSKKIKLAEMEEKHDREMNYYDNQVQKITTKYDRLRGSLENADLSENNENQRPKGKRRVENNSRIHPRVPAKPIDTHSKGETAKRKGVR